MQGYYSPQDVAIIEAKYNRKVLTPHKAKMLVNCRVITSRNGKSRLKSNLEVFIIINPAGQFSIEDSSGNTVVLVDSQNEPVWDMYPNIQENVHFIYLR